MNVSVIIATYGDESWSKLAQTRAYPSARAAGAPDILVGHDDDGTIASVRNALAEEADMDWLCFLDADDELAPGYLDAMKRACRENFLLTPAVRFVLRGRRKLPSHFSPAIDLREGNPLIIGTLVPRSRFLEVGGFREWPMFEDWDLWARCDLPVVQVPGATYLAHVSLTSRNRMNGVEARNYWHQRIGHDLWPDYYEATTPDEDRTQRSVGVRKLA